ncbi:uncharacterized protein LOC121366970, partial [Gigantopelta aegis]|uniref:uncharacterized protein LOC121366970 n=1 Tax=Gigantopelta aegis TaxID=1735272 RepID=UPI001B88B654
MAERVFKTTKTRIYRYFTYKQSYEYVDRLQTFANSYNSTYHRTIGMAPDKVTAEKETNIWWKIHTLLRGGLPLYRVKDYDGDEILGTFYQPELQQIDVKEDNLWKVEKILKTRGRGPNKEHYVKWLNCPKKFNSWVKASDVEH